MSVGFTCQAVVNDKRFVKQMIRMLGEEKRYEVRQEEDYMRVGFCRLGDVFFQFNSGLDGEIPAQMVYGECPPVWRERDFTLLRFTSWRSLPERRIWNLSWTMRPAMGMTMILNG